MENGKWIKNTIAVFTEVERRMVNPSFKFSQGGATIRTLDNFLQLFESEFGAITQDRLVDFCICTAYAYKGRDNWTIKQAFGPASIKRLKDSKHATRYYEDKWLRERSLDRNYLINLISDRSEHPQAKYIFMKSEEATKLRLLNSQMGYAICQSSTLGWSPISEACVQCNFIEQCKVETGKKYPELYRIRVEYGESTK